VWPVNFKNNGDGTFTGGYLITGGKPGHVYSYEITIDGVPYKVEDQLKLSKLK